MSYPPDDDETTKGFWDEEDVSIDDEGPFEDYSEDTPDPGGEFSSASQGEEDSSFEGLYLGDEGRYPVDLRRVLVTLLKGPYIDGRYQKELWATLLRDEAAVKRWLGEVFLELVTDTESKIAFAKQADTYEFKIPVLLRRNRLNFMESIIVVYLRQKLSTSGFKGERAVTSGKEILGWLEFFNKKKQNDPSSFQKQVTQAVTRIRDKYKLLRKLPGAGDRYEISPALKIILDPTEIETLKKVYKEIKERDSGADADRPYEGDPVEAPESGEYGSIYDSPTDRFSGGVLFESEEDLENEPGAGSFTGVEGDDYPNLYSEDDADDEVDDEDDEDEIGDDDY
jgi:hypothetical protein